MVLTETTTLYLEALADDGTFTFSEMTPALAALEPGDVIVGGVSARAPHGFLRKVKSVAPGCGKVVVETELATLEDAIQSAAIQGEMGLPPAQVRSATLAEGVTMATSPDGLRLDFMLKDFVLYDHDGKLDTKTDQVVATGKFSLDLTAEFALNIGRYYAGQCVTLDIGSYPNPAAIGLPNDQISSVKVGSNVRAVLCEHDDYVGVCETFTIDDPSLFWPNAIRDNMVSSVRVELRPLAMPDGE